MTSSSVSNLRTASTGPKISCWAIVMLSVTCTRGQASQRAKSKVEQNEGCKKRRRNRSREKKRGEGGQEEGGEMKEKRKDRKRKKRIYTTSDLGPAPR